MCGNISQLMLNLLALIIGFYAHLRLVGMRATIGSKPERVQDWLSLLANCITLIELILIINISIIIAIYCKNDRDQRNKVMG